MLDAHKMAHSSTPGKKDCHATWKLGLHAPTTDKGTSTGSRSLSPVLYNVYTNGPADQWFKPGAYACGRRAYLQNSQWYPHSSHRCPGAAGKGVTFVPRDRISNNATCFICIRVRYSVPSTVVWFSQPSLGTTKDTSIEAMSSIEARHKMEQFKAYFKTMQNSKNPLHDAVKEERRCGLARCKSWTGKAEQSTQHVYSLADIKPYHKTVRESRRTRPWMGSWKKNPNKQTKNKQTNKQTKSKQCRSTYRGFPTRMAYFYYISCLRYTILVVIHRYNCRSQQ